MLGVVGVEGVEIRDPDVDRGGELRRRWSPLAGGIAGGAAGGTVRSSNRLMELPYRLMMSFR
jgi:hypothetical protein